MEEKDYLIKSFITAGFSLSDKQAEQFLIYYRLLVDWNQRMNLTSITDFEDVVCKHFIDSCILINNRNVSRETLSGKMIDVGTGAGFPGIPLKIMLPNMNLTLLDSLNKRIEFLKVVCKECGISHVSFVHGRAEDVAHDSRHREYYDVAVSRAVANMSTLAELDLPFIRKGGICVSYKSGNIQEEVNRAKKAITVFGGELKSVDPFVIPGSNLARSFVIVGKIQNTPKKYPRKAGIPSKKPIE